MKLKLPGRRYPYDHDHRWAWHERLCKWWYWLPYGGPPFWG